MSICYNHKKKVFYLQNEFISYIISVEKERYLIQSYWGSAISDYIQTERPLFEGSSSPVPEDILENGFSLDTRLQEYPGNNAGDYRESAFEIQYADHSTVTQFEFKSFQIISGKPRIKGLPATYVMNEEEADTLEITMKDTVSQVEVVLIYTLYNDRPILTRTARFVNRGAQSVYLNKAMSMSVDFDHADFEMIQLPGKSRKERELMRTPLVRGVHTLDCKRGIANHVFQPFIALATPNTDEFSGEIYGFHLIYTGEFAAKVEVDPYYQTRIMIGINPEHFSWELKANEIFQCPEAVMVYSDRGLNGMSKALHHFYRERLVRGPHQFQERPVLLNNWEATYFDFTEDKLLALADNACELGIELFVLDDGWFGKRNDDTSSLGDWVVNREKLPKGLKNLAEKIRQKGLKFGLWFEPEMISKDSDLFRAHPDWHIHTEGRKESQWRNQYVLDFSRKEVRDNILVQMISILDEVPVDYIKWDFNRSLTEIGTASPRIRQTEVAHRYVLGLYEVLETLTTRYPHILFETCAGGGGRFEPGILHYMQQSWTSDNSDAIGRLEIQYGTSLLFPIITMGAHVSDVPNHQLKRTTSLGIRGDVAISGNLGYELDLTSLKEEDKQTIKEQISFYKKHRTLIQFGDFYRLLSPFNQSNEAAWIFVNEHKDKAIFFYFTILGEAKTAVRRVRLYGLDTDKFYKVDVSEEVISGEELMKKGLYIYPMLEGDFQNRRIYLEAER